MAQQNLHSSQTLSVLCPLLGTVHYWGLLLNKNGWEAGFCPLLGALPLLGSELLGEYSVYIFHEKPKQSGWSFEQVAVMPNQSMSSDGAMIHIRDHSGICSFSSTSIL